MGPERFSKQYQAVKASDIWSLGASIFELATEELPFCGLGGSLLKQGADMPELPETYSRTLNMICQACMVKETWNRPTAQQLADFAIKYIEGETPKITWKIPEDIEIPEDVVVEHLNKVAPKSEANDENNASEPKPIANDMNKTVQMSGDDMKKTMVNAPIEQKTVAMTPNAAESELKDKVTPEAKFALKSESKDQPFAVWVWPLVAIMGLLVGVMLNFFS